MLIEQIRTIFALAIPIMVGMFSTSLLYLVDTAMLGYLGSNALAAVAISEFTALLCYGLVTGIAHGVQANVSKYRGEGNKIIIAHPLNEGIVLSIIIGGSVALLLFSFTDNIFDFQTDEENIKALGVPYLQIQLTVMMFVGMNLSFRSFYNAIGKPGIAVFVQYFMALLNILLNYLLIFGKHGFPKLGVTGAGLGTGIALACGTLVYFVITHFFAKKQGFMQFPSRDKLQELFRLSWPVCCQTAFLYAGVITLIWIIGKMGTDELAAANVIMKLTMVIILPSFALGAATVTLVGIAVGKHDMEKAKKWCWLITLISGGVVGLLGLPLVFSPDWVLGFFIRDKHTMDVARLPMQLAGVSMAVEGAQFILMHALIGSGNTRASMLVSSITQWLISLPLCYIFAVYFNFGLTSIWIVISAIRLLNTLIYGFIWNRGVGLKNNFSK